MTSKRLLCITGNHVGAPPAPHLPSWDITVASGLKNAGWLVGEPRFRVGLVLDAGAFPVADLKQFLAAHRDILWVGAFRSTALSSPACRDLIADHFHDYHTLPFDAERLCHTLGHVLGWAQLRPQPAAEPVPDGALDQLSGSSAAIRTLRSQIAKIAKSHAPVLICGESGSGKELTASAIHRLSQRADGPFVAVNCGSMSPSLIQSELFGYEQGAFTGAGRAKAGLIESAEGGTIFLDEIADLPLDQQANLLRFLQEGTIYRIGATRSMKVNARVVAASHVDLEEAVAEGRFREDLFYRLHVLPLRVPPLRERRADLADLALYFFNKYSHEKNPLLQGFSNSALQVISEHHWPGNVRELINRIRRAMVLAEGRLIMADDLGFGAAPQRSPAPLGDSRILAERTAICSTLEGVSYNVSRAARELGVSRMTLYRLIAKHSISLSP